MYLTKLNFISKVIKSANDFVYNYDLKMIGGGDKKPMCHQIINVNFVTQFPFVTLLI